MKKLTLFIFLLFFFPVVYSQSDELAVVELSSRIKLFTTSSTVAELEGSSRYIQMGLEGSQTDVNAMLGYMDRFMVDGNDMIFSIESLNPNDPRKQIKFYLNPLYDANNFQQMLDMFGFQQFQLDENVRMVKDFSNSVYAVIKQNKSKGIK